MKIERKITIASTHEKLHQSDFTRSLTGDERVSLSRNCGTTWESFWTMIIQDDLREFFRLLKANQCKSIFIYSIYSLLHP